MTDKPLTVSWSGLQRWTHCRQKQLRTMEGRANKADGRIFLPGTVTDRCMRRWLELEDPQPGQMPTFAEEYLEEHSGEGSEYVIKWRGSPAADKAAILKDVTEMLRVLEPYLYKLVIPFRYQPEYRFRVPFGVPDLNGKIQQITLIGGMDILTQDDDQAYGILDLKATHDDAYAKKVLGQLIFYAVALQASFQLSFDHIIRAGFLTPGCKTKFVPVQIGPNDLQVMHSHIVAYCHGVWRNEWDPKADDSGCNWCECKHACSKFALPEPDAAGKRRISFEEMADRKRALRKPESV